MSDLQAFEGGLFSLDQLNLDFKSCSAWPLIIKPPLSPWFPIDLLWRQTQKGRLDTAAALWLQLRALGRDL